jgi:diadenosine tetraphosphatase ApaH/serine/threonine PP2A family protein phosphatase
MASTQAMSHDTPADSRHIRPDLTGPFDIIGDVHGCAGELEDLLALLGYHVEWGPGEHVRSSWGPHEYNVRVTPPGGRRAVFVGDLVDRGPRTPDTLRIVMSMCAAGTALCVMGNHDHKFRRWIDGREVTVSHGLAESAAQMGYEPRNFRTAARTFLANLPFYLQLDNYNLLVVHAGIEAWMIGKTSAKITAFCMYGDVSGPRDANGLSQRYNWASGYGLPATVVYGHTPVREPARVNNTVCIDTGCVFGGSLTAMRWPEQTFVSIPARRTYAQTLRPFGLPPARPVRPISTRS